jgi:hypothetical protein
LPCRWVLWLTIFSEIDGANSFKRSRYLCSWQRKILLCTERERLFWVFELATGPCREPVESSWHSHAIRFSDYFGIRPIGGKDPLKLNKKAFSIFIPSFPFFLLLSTLYPFYRPVIFLKLKSWFKLHLCPSYGTVANTKIPLVWTWEFFVFVEPIRVCRWSGRLLLCMCRRRLYMCITMYVHMYRRVCMYIHLYLWACKLPAMRRFLKWFLCIRFCL